MIFLYQRSLIRKRPAASALLAVTLLLLSLASQAAEMSPFTFFGGGSQAPAHILSGLSTEKKTMLIRTFFASSKAYLNSKEFLIRYQGTREMYRPVPQNLSGGVSHLANQSANLEASAKLVSQLIPKAPKEQQQVLKNQLALIRNQQILLDDPDAPVKAWRQNFPESPDQFVLTLLENFLENTKDIDFNATMKTERNGKQYFSDPVHQSKSPAWKFCYHAGKESTALARELARIWVNELANKRLVYN